MEDSFEMPTEEDLGDARGAQFITEEGWYHVEIIKYDANPVNRTSGEPVRAKRIDVVAHTSSAATDQKGRSKSFDFYLPHKDQGDSGRFCRIKLGNLYIATGIVDPKSTGKMVTIDHEEMIGRQFICRLAFGKDREGNKNTWLDIKGTDIYHVDDKAVADKPKCSIALSTLPATCRHINNDSSADPDNLSGISDSKDDDFGDI